MRRRIGTALAVLALLVGAAPAGAHGTRTAPTAVLKTCHPGYTHAVVGGAEKCLHAGEYCAVRYSSTYRRYGYTCSGSPARLRRR